MIISDPDGQTVGVPYYHDIIFLYIDMDFYWNFDVFHNRIARWNLLKIEYKLVAVVFVVYSHQNPLGRGYN